MPPPPGNPPQRRRATGVAPAGGPARATGTNAKRAPRVAKLVCTAGPASGQEFPLEGDEVVIGRAAENPVSIPDTSVSRKHALVRKTGDGWAVSDLGSGNGTVLNGDVIADETVLANDDKISLGDTEFKFVGSQSGAAAAALAPAPAPARRAPVRTSRQSGVADEPTAARGRVRTSRMAEDPVAKAAKRRKIFVRVGGVAAVILALLVGWKAIDNKRQVERGKRLAASEQHRGEMAEMFQDAKNLALQGKWVEAKAKLEEIEATDPEYEVASIKNYLDRADREIPNQKLLIEAATALKNNEVGKAATAINSVKTTQVQQENKVKQLREQLDALVVTKLSEARALLAFGSDLTKMQALKALCEDILIARPDDREATEFKKQSEQAIFRIQNPTIAPPPVETPWLDVQTRFKNGDASGALSLAQACAAKHAPCRQLEANLKDFDTKSKALESLSENDLLALFELDKKIAGGSPSDLSKPIRTRIAATFYLKASNAKTTANWTRAIEYSRRVLSADPAHVGAQAIINDARTQAKDVYLRGYQLKETSPDEAAKLFKEVLAMTPKDDEYHQKADARLTELQKQ